MKKTNVSPLHEIKSTDIQRLNDYLEDAVKLFAQSLLKTTNGTITGLNVTKVDANTFAVAPGAIYINGFFGELESPGSGSIDITLPTSGTRTDTIAAYYEEVEDTPGSGYVLVDVSDEARAEQLETNNTRKLGAAKIQVYQGTAVGSIPADRTPIATLTVTNTGITTVDNSVKKFSAAGVVSEISNAADNNATGIKASRTATANMLLSLDASKNFNIGTGILTAGGGQINGNLTVTGTLSVPSGSTIQTSSVSANTLELNSNIPASGTPYNGDSGIVVNRGNVADAALLWDEVNDKWKLTTGGLQLSDGGIDTTTGSFSDTVTVDKSNTKGLLFGVAASGTRLYSTSSTADTIDLTGVLTGLTASSGITITGSGHSRTIKANGILSVAGSGAISASTTNQATTVSIANATTGAVGVVKVGSGLAVDGAGTISNNDKGSTQQIFKVIGNGTGTSQFAASGNMEMLRFDATSGVAVAFDAANRKVTFTNTGIISASNGTSTTASVTNGNLTISLNAATTGAIGGLKLGNANGTALGTASPGANTDTAARVDHVHPTTGLAVLSTNNTYGANTTQTFVNAAATRLSLTGVGIVSSGAYLQLNSPGTLASFGSLEKYSLSSYNEGLGDPHLGFNIPAGHAFKIRNGATDLFEVYADGVVKEGGTKLSDKYLQKPDVCAVIVGSTSVALTAGSWSVIQPTIELVDTNSMHDSTTNQSRITIKKNGAYRVEITGIFTNTGTGGTGLRIKKNGVIVADGYTQKTSTSNESFGITRIYTAVAGDYFEVEAFKSSTATGTINFDLDDEDGHFLVQQLY